MSLNVNPRNPSPCLQDVSFDLFETIAKNSERFLEIQQEMQKILADLQKQNAQTNRVVMQSLAQIDTEIGAIRAKIHSLEVLLPGIKSFNALKFQGVIERLSAQEKKMDKLFQKVDSISCQVSQMLARQTTHMPLYRT